MITYQHNNAVDIGVDIEIVRKSLEKPIKYLALISKLVENNVQPGFAYQQTKVIIAFNWPNDRLLVHFVWKTFILNSLNTVSIRNFFFFLGKLTKEHLTSKTLRMHLDSSKYKQYLMCFSYCYRMFLVDFKIIYNYLFSKIDGYHSIFAKWVKFFSGKNFFYIVS